jgi:hypothetical protein
MFVPHGFSVITEFVSVRFCSVMSRLPANSVRAASRTSEPFTVPDCPAIVTL